MPTKNQLRPLMRARRAAQSESERAAASARLCERLKTFWQAHDFNAACVYLALPDEANIDEFIRWLLSQGVPLWAPRGVDWAPLMSLDEVETGPFGTREPCECRMRNVECGINGRLAVFVPGLAFDKRGGRLGFGGGWYDRALARFPQENLTKIGVAFAFQIVDEVPIEPHDVTMDFICME
jgi:5-formyltetrahydrofolate cyclo-ligase